MVTASTEPLTKLLFDPKAKPVVEQAEPLGVVPVAVNAPLDVLIDNCPFAAVALLNG